MTKTILIAACDEQSKMILKNNCYDLIGEDNVIICNTFGELHKNCLYKDNIAVIFDKYFLGYVVSFELSRLKVLNQNMLTYIAEIGQSGFFYGLRIYQLGMNGLIENIEHKEKFKNCFLKIKEGIKTFPESILSCIDSKSSNLDARYTSEVTEKEMLVGMYLGLGKSQKEICELTGLAASTISTHITRLKRKIGYSKPNDYYLLNKRYFGFLKGDCIAY